MKSRYAQLGYDNTLSKHEHGGLSNGSIVILGFGSIELQEIWGFGLMMTDGEHAPDGHLREKHDASESETPKPKPQNTHWVTVPWLLWQICCLVSCTVYIYNYIYTHHTVF